MFCPLCLERLKITNAIAMLTTRCRCAQVQVFVRRHRSPAHGKVGNNHFITLRGKFAILKSQRLIEESNVTGCGLSNFILLVEGTVSSPDSESESSVNRPSFGSVKCLDPATDRRVGLYG